MAEKGAVGCVTAGGRAASGPAAACGAAAAGAAVGCAAASGFLLRAASMSALTMRPWGPVPFSLARSSPDCSAMRRASGLAKMRSPSPRAAPVVAAGPAWPLPRPGLASGLTSWASGPEAGDTAGSTGPASP